MADFVAYYRVSTQRQGDSGLGLEAQRAQVARYVESIAGNIVAEFTEVESGKRVTRPQLDAAIAAAVQHRGTLIVAKLDRLARNTRVILKIRDSKLPVTFCDLPNVPDGALGRFMITQMAAIAEFERDLISERTKAALQIARSRGKKLGVNGRALARRNRGRAQAFARGIAELIDVSTLTVAAAMQLLNDRGITTPTGRPWGKTTTQRLLSRMRLLDA